MALETTLETLTQLSAVNSMLRSIGQGTINTLGTSESVDAENAKTQIHETSREVQERGWWFNKEANYELLVDQDGNIPLPANCLQFSPAPLWRGLVERGGRLYDTRTHTYEFPAGTVVKGTVVFFLPFDELPQAARTYIARKAGREFQIGAVGSDLLYRFTKEMEDEALAALTRAHLRAEQPNAITDHPATYRTARGGRIPR